MASCPCLYMERLFVYNEYCAQRGVLLGYAFCFQRSFRKQQPSSPQTVIRVFISVSCVVFWYRGSSKAVECLEFLRCDPWWALFSFWVLILYKGLWKVCLMLCFYFLPRFSTCVLESHLLTCSRSPQQEMFLLVGIRVSLSCYRWRREGEFYRNHFTHWGIYQNWQQPIVLELILY